LPGRAMDFARTTIALSSVAITPPDFSGCNISCA